MSRYIFLEISKNEKVIIAFVLDSSRRTGRIFISDMYKVTEVSSILHQVTYGQWDRKTGIKVVEPCILKRRSNLHGHEFRYDLDIYMSLNS